MDVCLDQSLLRKRVVVVVANTKYEGVVADVSPGNSIQLWNVTSETLKKTFPKPVNFFANDIQSVTCVLEAGADVQRSTADSSSRKGKAVCTNRSPVNHLSKLNNHINQDVLLNRTPQLPKKEAEVPTSMFNLPPYVVIDSIDENFYKAIKEAMEQSIIGVSMEGVRVGREGIVCWIGIATEEKVFLFYMCALGPPGIKHGLGDLFTHEGIIKVIHDCRFVADALLHKYGVQLCNVFDTQVADATLHKKRTGSYSNYVNSLANCLETHLDLPRDAIFFKRVRSSTVEEDEGIWRECPLPQHLEHGAVLQVCHLRKLRVVLIEKLLQDVTRGTELYVRDISSLPDSEAVFKQDSAHLLPRSFRALASGSQTGTRNGEDAPRKLPGRECDPYLRFSRDVMHLTNK